MKIVNLGAAWPFPACSVESSRETWFESVQEHYLYGLNVLPPISVGEGFRSFFVSEASAHDARGVPIFVLWTKEGDRYFLRDVARDRAKAALVELRDKLRRCRFCGGGENTPSHAEGACVSA